MDHAKEGAEMALHFLLDSGWTGERAQRVSAAIRQHRYRSEEPPESLEAKILFDADKLDVTGAMGIARTLQYQGRMGHPLYHLDAEGAVLPGQKDPEPSFLHEYCFKLKTYMSFFTRKGTEMAETRKKTAEAYFAALLDEIQVSTERKRLLSFLKNEFHCSLDKSKRSAFLESPQKICCILP